MPAARHQSDLSQPPRLVARFAVYSGVAVVLAVVGALILVRFNATSEAEDHLADDAAYVADELSRDDVGRTAFDRPANADERALLDEFLGRIAAARGVARTTLVSLDGVITYSTDHELIGKRNDSLGGTMFDARVPFRWMLDARRIRGTLVAERDDATIAAEIRRTFLIQSALVVLALLVLYAALIPVFRRVTAALADREARYRALTEQASDGIVVFDREGCVLEANAMLARMTGYPRDELVGMHLSKLIARDDLARLPLRFGEVLDGKTVLQERTIVRRDRTTLLGEFHGKMLADGRIVASLRDVTERKRIERELLEAQKQEAVGRFAGGVADDFVELLGTIARRADAIAKRARNDTDVAEIRSAVEWGRSLAAQLLAIGSKHELRPEMLDLNSIVDEMRGALEHLVGERIDVVFRPGAVDRVRADADHLHQVLLDLVLHARMAMPGGGTVTIETSNVDFSSNGRGGLRGPHVMLAISDTGDRRDSESRPFVDGDDEGGERLGLGLAAVYGVVHQSGGSVGIESAPGVGTTVRIYLPSADAALRASLSRTQSA
jgi:PAS domain S-box-containing protein